jgi:starch-binding outer membrane protein, SusD/RagB family
MMKTIKIFCVLMLLVAVSCTEDFVTLTPNNQKVVDNFYKTPKDALEGLIAAYAVLPWDGWGNIWLTSEIASDNTFAGTGKSDDGKAQFWDRFQKSTDPNLNSEPWKKYTFGIYRANILLENLDNVNWGTDENLRAQYEAEARFLRAYYHFDWVRLFGHVPVLDKTLTPSEAFKPQSEPLEVYALIASDLKFAIENLPATAFSDISTEYYGRATKWAAEALMARVFLFYTGYYNQADLAGVVTKAEARAYIDDVIDNSGHNLVQGTDGFKRLWRASSFEDGGYVGEDNIETVFAIKHTYKGLANWNYDEGFGNRWQKFIGIRTQDIYPYAGGWGFATVTEELFNAYESGDTRREASIIDLATEVPSFSTIDQRQYTGYAIKKFSPTLDADNRPTVVNLGGNDQLDGFDDLPVIRFSDVLLMGAELHVDGGDAGKAQSYLDRVRDRAFEDTDHRITVTKAAIMEERRLELAFEGHRYYDLLRQGLDVAKAAIDHDDTNNDFDVTFRTETGGFLEIPNNQVALSNGTLNQNTGY